MRPDPAFGLLELYDDALPHVYGYLLARCGDAGLAEDLTAESFLAAVQAVRKPGGPDPSDPPDLIPPASAPLRGPRLRQPRLGRMG